MQSKQYFTKIKNYPHEKSTEPIFVENNHALLYENKILDHLLISFLCVLLA